MVTRTIKTLAWLLIAFSAGVSAQQPMAKLVNPEDDLEEIFQEEVPVSGRVVAGIAISGSAGMNALAVIPPATDSGGDRVCIEVVSRDGQYHSRNTFVLPSPIQHWPVRLDYRSEHPDYIKTRRAKDLAVLGSPGDCSSGKRDKFYVTGSGPGPSNVMPKNISIFVNSGRTEAYVAVIVDGLRVGNPQRCAPIDAERRTGFDTLCNVEVEKDLRDGDGLSLQILRRRYDQMLPATDITVVLPDAE